MQLLVSSAAFSVHHHLSASLQTGKKILLIWSTGSLWLQMVELLSYCKAVMTDNHRIATQLISLGVAVPSLGIVTVPPPPALAAALRDHSIVQQRSGIPLGSEGVLSGVVVPTNASTGSLGPFVGLRSSEVSLVSSDMDCITHVTLPCFTR